MTHFEASQRSEVGIKLSLGSGGGCNSLKNSSTCNIKVNQHASITNNKYRESQMCITHIGREEESIAGRDSELSFGCD